MVGKYDLVVVTPEMMLSARFGELICDAQFLKQLGWLFIDKMHLVDEWGQHSACLTSRLAR